MVSVLTVAALGTMPVTALAADAAAGTTDRFSFGEPETLGVPLRGVMIRSGTIGPWRDGRPVAYVSSASKGLPISFSVLDLATGERLAGHQITGMSTTGDAIVAADGKVYIACSRDAGAMLVRYDPQRDEMTKLGVPVPGETFMTRTVSDDDGVVYGGTYPSGHVFRYDPRKQGDDAFTDMGPIAEGEFYARSLAWVDGTLYVGTGTHARLFAMDPASGDRREIEMPDAADDEEFVHRINHRDGLLFVYVSPSLDHHVYDIEAGRWIDHLERNGDGGISGIDDQGHVYYVSLQENSLMQYDLEVREASAVDDEAGPWNWNTARVMGVAPLDEPDYPGLSVVGVSLAGEIARWNPQTGAGSRVQGDPLGTGIRIRHLGVGPDGNIYVGGSFTPGIMGRYLVDQEKLEQIGGPRGRVDSYEIHQCRFYYGTYTDAGVWAWDPEAGPWDFGTNPRRVFKLSDQDQERVYALASAGDRLAVGGIGIKGELNGVLAFYDAKSDQLDVKGPVIPGHGIASLVVEGNVLIGGTSIHQIGADPIAPAAKLFLWDLENDSLIWQGVPVPDAPSISDLVVGDQGRLWGLTTLGVAFEFDLETREVLHAIKVGNTGGMWGMGSIFFGKDGMLYGSLSSGSGGVFSLDPRTHEVTQLGVGEHAVADARGRIYYAHGAELRRLSPISDDGAVAADDTSGRDRPYALADLHEQGIPPLLEGIETQQQWQAKLDEIRQVWMRYVGGVPDKVPVRYEVLSETREKGHLRQEIIYDTVHGDRITAYLLIPDDLEPGEKRPAVLALHSTGAGGKDFTGLADGGRNRIYGYELVMRGYVVLVPDALTAGDRIGEGHRSFRSAPFYEQYPNWSTVGKNIVDHMQGVDLLTSLEFVDPDAIGAIGYSFGGYNAYFLAGMDPRIKAVVSSCGVSPFAYDMKQPQHWGVRDWYTHLPRITPDLERGVVPFEFNEIIALAAPTPMFYYSAQSDHIFPHWKGVGEVMVDLRNLYVWLGNEDRFESVMGVHDHDFPPPIREMAYDFLDRWLRKPSDEPPR